MIGEGQPFKWTIFISSTVYDLQVERATVRSLLEKSRGAVRFRCLSSEEDDFPITPKNMGELHSYDVCLDNIALADFMVLLIKTRYGRPRTLDDGEQISITHQEYREAFRRRLPIFIFVEEQTWNARFSHNRHQPQSVVAPGQVALFSFLDEITRQERNNWIFQFSSSIGVRNRLKSTLLSFDDSTFVGDVTIPDGQVVPTGRAFRKTWAIRNSGCQVWRDRFLRAENVEASNLKPEQVLIPIPETKPGGTVEISVLLTAPKYPSTCVSYWKMVDAEGRHCFPKYVGLYCKVKITY